MAKKSNIALPAEPMDAEDFDITYEALERGQKAREIRKARTSTGLTQVEFAERFLIPVGTLRDWEQARVTAPDFAVAYAKLIAADRAFVEREIA